MIDPSAAPATRADIVRLARAWVGTPYHHQASLRGVGTDCLGLVRGVLRELAGIEPVVPPAYSRDWAEASGEETMLAGARLHLHEAAIGGERPGDVLVFRLKAGLVAKHAAILASPATMIHAVEGAAVSEVAYAAWWRRRLAGVFTFRELDH